MALQPWGTGPGRFDDRPLAEAIAERLDGRAEVLPAPSGLRAAGDTYRDAHALISLRPRATIAAAAAGVPVLALVDSDRHAAVANGLGQPVVRTEAPAGEADRRGAGAHARTCRPRQRPCPHRPCT
ncbi:MAG: hypothetical protein M3N57_06140 [Actinomycetota bacterium]|nr:hypothetical protein [Actinomycetota bacterium]